jgi:hypothetical protein
MESTSISGSVIVEFQPQVTVAIAPVARQLSVTSVRPIFAMASTRAAVAALGAYCCSSIVMGKEHPSAGRSFSTKADDVRGQPVAGHVVDGAWRTFTGSAVVSPSNGSKPHDDTTRKAIRESTRMAFGYSKLEASEPASDSEVMEWERLRIS